jgi:hypothetical protein
MQILVKYRNIIDKRKFGENEIEGQIGDRFWGIFFKGLSIVSYLHQEPSHKFIFTTLMERMQFGFTSFKVYFSCPTNDRVQP